MFPKLYKCSVKDLTQKEIVQSSPNTYYVIGSHSYPKRFIHITYASHTNEVFKSLDEWEIDSSEFKTMTSFIDQLAVLINRQGEVYLLFLNFQEKKIHQIKSQALKKFYKNIYEYEIYSTDQGIIIQQKMYILQQTNEKHELQLILFQNGLEKIIFQATGEGDNFLNVYKVQNDNIIAILYRRTFKILLIHLANMRQEEIMMMESPEMKIKHILRFQNRYIIFVKDRIDRIYKVMINQFVKSLQYGELKNNSTKIKQRLRSSINLVEKYSYIIDRDGKIFVVLSTIYKGDELEVIANISELDVRTYFKEEEADEMIRITRIGQSLSKQIEHNGLVRVSDYCSVYKGEHISFLMKDAYLEICVIYSIGESKQKILQL